MVYFPLTEVSDESQMMYLSSVYYGVTIISLIYFLLFLASIIRNFANILGIKVLKINLPPQEKIAEISNDELDDSIEKDLIDEKRDSLTKVNKVN